MQQMQVRFAKKNDGIGLVLLDRVILQEAKENVSWTERIAVAKMLCLRKKAGPMELNKVDK